MNSNNLNNTTVNNSSMIKTISDEESSLLNPLNLLYLAIPSMLITIAILFTIYVMRKKNIEKEEIEKAEKSMNEFVRSKYYQLTLESKSNCDGSSNIIFVKRRVESEVKNLSLVETISKQREFTIKNEMISTNDSPNVKKVCSIRKTKPILYKLYNKCKEDAKSLNNYKKTENDIMEVKTKSFNLYSYKSEQKMRKIDIPRVMEVKVSIKGASLKNSPQLKSIQII